MTGDDYQEALSTTLAFGDHQFEAQDHHGTPEERQTAWKVGYDTGDAGRCSQHAGIN
jgi:predicted metalloprotease